MLGKRIIPCLDVRDGRVVKGQRFKDHVDVGDIEELALRYVEQGADELVFYDIAASADNRTVDTEWIKRLSRIINIPFCVAGGIHSIEIAEKILNAGADKLSINSPALHRPSLIDELALTFGRQCIVIGIDSLFETDDWYVWAQTGRTETMRTSHRLTRDWIAEVQDRGAGEVVLNCMDQDGVRRGYDLEQMKTFRALCKVPLIASGGAGSPADFVDVFREAKVDGALAAGVFHRRELTVAQVKTELMWAGIPVRPPEFDVKGKDENEYKIKF